MLTVREYLALSRPRRRRYRLYRHPLVMFGIGPVYAFVLKQRLPFGLMRSGWQPWASTMATNLGIAALAALMIWLVGLVPFLMVHLPITFLAAAIGVWLFYVQHQFEETFWDRNEDWEFLRGGIARKLALRPAACAALVHRQYRHPPHSPFVQPNPLLPPAPGSSATTRSRRHRDV